MLLIMLLVCPVIFRQSLKTRRLCASTSGQYVWSALLGNSLGFSPRKPPIHSSSRFFAALRVVACFSRSTGRRGNEQQVYLHILRNLHVSTGCFLLGWLILLIISLGMVRKISNDLRDYTPQRWALLLNHVSQNQRSQMAGRMERQIEGCSIGFQVSPSTFFGLIPVMWGIFLGHSVWGIFLMPLCVWLMGGQLLVWMSGRLVWALALALWAVDDEATGAHAVDVRQKHEGLVTGAEHHRPLNASGTEIFCSFNSIWSLCIGEHCSHLISSFIFVFLQPCINAVVPFWSIWKSSGFYFCLRLILTYSVLLLGRFLWAKARIGKGAKHNLR